MPLIRPESPADLPAIRRVNQEAFGRAVEADLVDDLRRAGALAGVRGIVRYRPEFPKV